MVFSFVSRAVGVTDWAAVDKSWGRASGRGWRLRRGAEGGSVAAVPDGHRRAGGDRRHHCRRRRRGEPVGATRAGAVGRPRQHDDEVARGNFRGFRRGRRPYACVALRLRGGRGGHRVDGRGRRQRRARYPHRCRVFHWRACRRQPVGAGRIGRPDGVVARSGGLLQVEGSKGLLGRTRDTRYGTRGPGSRADRNAKT